jgi:hypothetical protein
MGAFLLAAGAKALDFDGVLDLDGRKNIRHFYTSF